LIREGETTQLRSPPPYSPGGWSPYLGREVGLAPLMVMVNGRIVARDGRLADELVVAPPVEFAQA